MNSNRQVYLTKQTVEVIQEIVRFYYSFLQTLSIYASLQILVQKNTHAVRHGKKIRTKDAYLWTQYPFKLFLSQNTIPNCPVLEPTVEEFQNFNEYMEKIKNMYAKSFGMIKVIPPKSWRARASDYSESLSNLVIKNPIQQNPEGQMGVYEFKHIGLPSITYSDFIKTYQSRQNCLNNLSVDEVQNLFWKNLPYSPPVYGADILGTLMESTAGSWNLNELDTILQKGLQRNLRGVNTSYCYIGSWKALFCWHKQDLDLDAINYLHFGKSKFWYCIQEDDSKYLENESKRCFFRGFDLCPEFLRHKTCLINPYSLKKKFPALKITKMQQKANQFIIAFSGAYHCGFNFGINVAEAVNFATLDWLYKISKVKYCRCKKSSVKIATSSVVSKLLALDQYKNNLAITKLQSELSEQKSQDNLSAGEYEKENKYLKTKKIEKKPRRMTEKLKTKEKTRQKLENVEQVKYIQCDLCDAWHELPPQNNQMADEDIFVCKNLGKECTTEVHAEVLQFSIQRPSQ